MWYTLVLGYRILVGAHTEDWQPVGFAQKHTRLRGKARERILRDARILLKQLHARGFKSWEVRIAHHKAQGFPAQGRLFTVEEIERGEG